MKIYGVFHPGESNEILAALTTKMNLILSCDSYKSDNYVAEGLGIGRVYSPIASADNQPIWNDEHTKSIIVVGKIFDYGEKKEKLTLAGHRFQHPKSDAEYILHAIDEWGDAAIKDLNGVYNFALYDASNRILRIVNDRYGMKPLYYHYSEPAFTFASEVKAVIQNPRIERNINWRGWRDYFCYGHLLGTKTFFRDIHSLPGGSILTLTPDGMSLKKYWNYTDVAIDHASSEQCFITKGAALIRQAVARQSRDLKECIVLLSGGYDSRCLASVLKCYTDITLETFTTSIVRIADIDPVLARRIAKKLEIRNTYVPISSDFYQKYFVAKVIALDGMCAEHIDMFPLVDKLKAGRINFDGLAGDVLLKGLFVNMENLSHVDDHKKLAVTIDRQMRGLMHYMIDRRQMPSNLAIATIVDFFAEPIRKELKPTTDSIYQELTHIGTHENLVTIFFISNRTKNTVSPLSNVVIDTKATCFFPFLDNDLVEFSLSIPPAMKISKEIYFKMLLMLLGDVARIPSTNLLNPSLKNFFHIAESKKFDLLLMLLHLVRLWVVSKIVRLKIKESSKITFLMGLLDSLSPVPYIDMGKLKQKTEEYLEQNKDPSPFLVPMLEFCVWYNSFCLHNGEDR
jgi:asparagine synthase (glutamine-hydrolysing)